LVSFARGFVLFGIETDASAAVVKKKVEKKGEVKEI